MIKMIRIALVVLMVSCSPDARCQLSEVAIKDSTFLRAVNLFLDSVAQVHFNDEVVVLIRITKLELAWVHEPVDGNVREQAAEKLKTIGVTSDASLIKKRKVLSYVLLLSMERSLSTFEEEAPAYYFWQKGRKCFVAFNVESLFEHSKSARKSILNEAGKSIRKILGTSVLAAMEISVNDDEITVGPFGH